MKELPPDPIAEPVSPVSPWNIANALTMLRLLLVPVFVVALFWEDGHQTSGRIAAAVIFAIASITDRFDGKIARERGLVTEFGKLMDPIADKALVGTALIGLSMLGDLHWAITIVMVGREIGVTLLRFWVVRHGVISASRGGKLKTALQTAAIMLYVLDFGGWIHGIAIGVMFLAVAVALLTGLDYVDRAIKLRRRSKAAKAANASGVDVTPAESGA